MTGRNSSRSLGRARSGPIGAVLLAVMCGIASAARAEWHFQDPLDTPAMFQSNLAQRPLLGVARAGKRLIAVGSRGLIAVSDDHGKSWRQVPVPVQSDLLAVSFAGPSEGWVCGHDGVILHSSDGGNSWVKQLDGRIAQPVFEAYYKMATVSGDKGLQAVLETVQRNFQAGPSLPYLDIYFDDAQHGFASGSFGMLVATNDGGRSWQPWLDRIDNPDFLNLNAIRRIGDQIYIAGEKGSVFRLDRAKQRFISLPTGYDGSLFGITGDAKLLLVFGLRGNIYRSLDQGTHWQSVPSHSDATLTTAAPIPAGRGFLLADDAGQFVVGQPGGTDFSPGRAQAPMLFTDLVPLDATTMLATGMQGVRAEPIGMPGR